MRHFSDVFLSLCRGVCAECAKTHSILTLQGPKCNITWWPEPATPPPQTPLFRGGWRTKASPKGSPKTPQKVGVQKCPQSIRSGPLWAAQITQTRAKRGFRKQVQKRTSKSASLDPLRTLKMWPALKREPQWHFSARPHKRHQKSSKK